MSLRVNLILNSEKRSGSRINATVFIRLGRILIPIIIIFIVGNEFIKYSETSNKLRALEASWDVAEPKQKQSKELLSQLHYNTRTAEELESWKKSRIEWHKQLEAIAKSIPVSIQATTIFVSSALDSSSVPSPPVRKFTLTVDGKNSGEGAMDYIEIFKKCLENHPLTTNIIESIDVSNYEADTSDNATEFDRIFQIECIYKSLPKEPLK